jgi:hypothetical protein
MRFYTTQHRYYCGIDLHTRSLYVCILNQEGEVMVHRNLPPDPVSFLSLIAPYRDDIAVAAECTFTWYWLADLCQREEIPFVLGHALYMKAIHGGKTKNDRIDSSSAQKSPQANAAPDPGRRSVTPTSNGHSPKPPSSSSGPTQRGSSTNNDWRRNTAKPKHSPSSHTDSHEPYITCS